MPRRNSVTSASIANLISDTNELLTVMLSLMCCPDCDGTGRMPSGNHRGRPSDARDERCDCRREAQRYLDELADDGDDDEDEDEDEADERD